MLISEFFFDWLQLIDTCLNVPVTPRIAQLLCRDGKLRRGEPPPGAANILGDLYMLDNDLDVGENRVCGCPMCLEALSAGPLPMPYSGPAVFSPVPPVAAVGQLFPHRDWPFDHHPNRGGSILLWVAERLEDYLRNSYWASPCAVFPAPTRSLPPLFAEAKESLQGLPESNVYRPDGIGFASGRETGPWLRLLHCAPLHEPMTAEGLRWLPYLLRAPIEEDCLVRFPPLTSALHTFTSCREFYDGAAMSLFGAFKTCDVEFGLPYVVPPWSACRHSVTYRGINGITVCFLAMLCSSNTLPSPIASTEERVGLLLGSPAGGLVILQDLLDHGGCLCSLSTKTWLVGLDRLFDQASKTPAPFSGMHFTRHASRLLKMKFRSLGCRWSRGRFFDSRRFGHHLWPVWRDFLNRCLHLSTSQSSRRLDLLVVLYGCALGTYFNILLSVMVESGPCIPRGDGTKMAAGLTMMLSHLITPLLHGCELQETLNALTRNFQLRLRNASLIRFNELTDTLRQVGDWVSMVLRTYACLIDGDRFVSLFAPALIYTILQESPSSPVHVAFPSYDQNSRSDLAPAVPPSTVIPFFLDLLYLGDTDPPPRDLKFLLTIEEREREERHEMSLRVAAAIAARRQAWSYASGAVLLRSKPRSLPMRLRPPIKLLLEPTIATGGRAGNQSYSTATWCYLSMFPVAALALLLALWSWALARTRGTPLTQM